MNQQELSFVLCDLFLIGNTASATGEDAGCLLTPSLSITGTLWTLVMSYDTNVVSRTKKAAQLAPDILRYIKAAVTRGS